MSPFPTPLAFVDNIDWNAALQQVVEQVTQWAPLVLAAIAIFFIGKIVARIIRAIVRKVMIRAKVDETLVNFCVNILYTGLLAFVCIAALDKLGVPTDSLVAILAAAGLAIGFALQGSLSNFAAGVMIIIFQPFKLQDLIEGAGVTGVVEDIQVFNTVMRTLDNKKVIVPNAELTSGVLTNFSGNKTRRVDLVAGIGYGDDIPKAKAILEDILEKEPLVLADPAPAVALIELADSSVNFNVRPWCKTEDYWDCYSAVTEQIKLRFDAEGINIPFPQRDVHLHQVA